MSEPIKILLVEDNPGDVELTRIHLEEAKVLHQLECVDNGKDALRFLRRETPYQNAMIPDLVLLDLNLPGLSGIEVLQEIKHDDALKHIPVVILTSSDAESDIAASYRSHANAYVTKPVNLEQFGEIIRSIEGFWLTVVRLPNVKE